uniref:DM13 domain-containing protein n=1 Tax=Ascaris lumbricoides TaxID=6252 RepID=A0A0M3HKB8_ASCLU
MSCGLPIAGCESTIFFHASCDDGCAAPSTFDSLKPRNAIPFLSFDKQRPPKLAYTWIAITMEGNPKEYKLLSDGPFARFGSDSALQPDKEVSRLPYVVICVYKRKEKVPKEDKHLVPR